MSVVINYKFGAECSEEELVARLGRLRTHAIKLEGVTAGEIRRIEPCYSKMLFRELELAGEQLPQAVQQRVKEAKKKGDDFTELWLGLSALEPHERLRFTEPAADFISSTDLWRADDYPAEFSIGSALTYSRGGILLEFANALLLRGYVLVFRLGEGCDPVTVPLASYRCPGVPLWCGGGFTRTQYAVQFARDHEHVCRILDMAEAEGLLLGATDTVDFYKHRDWRRSAPIVNRETDFIAALSAAFDRPTKKE
jgi:hypothetical protein